MGEKLKSAVRSLKSKHAIFLLLTFFLVIISFFLLDKAVLGHNKILDGIFSIVKENYSYAFVAICVFLAFSLFSRKYKSKMAREIASFLLAIAISSIIKFAIGRVRPGLGISGYSFPSNHSTAMFSLLPFFKSWHYYVWLLVSLFVAASRVYWRYHYFSDVFAGAFIGYGVGLLIERMAKKIQKTKD
jgi:membrane-associated phospholipid phosphatase